MVGCRCRLSDCHGAIASPIAWRRAFAPHVAPRPNASPRESPLPLIERGFAFCLHYGFQLAFPTDRFLPPNEIRCCAFSRCRPLFRLRSSGTVRIITAAGSPFARCSVNSVPPGCRGSFVCPPPADQRWSCCHWPGFPPQRQFSLVSRPSSPSVRVASDSKPPRLLLCTALLSFAGGTARERCA